MNAPLRGRRILVTRTRERAEGLVDAIQASEGEAVVVPLLTTTPVADPEQVRLSFHEAVDAPGAWVVFTSATAVRLVLGALEPELFATVQVAAVGMETAAALHAQGVAPAAVGHATAADLAGDLARTVASGTPVWFPAALDAGDVLERVLGSAGASVRRLPLYRTDMPQDAPRRLAAAMRSPLDAVTLTSGSAARNLVRALEGATSPGATLPDTTLVACIGEPTAATARELRLPNVAAAAHPTVEALVELLSARLASPQQLP